MNHFFIIIILMIGYRYTACNRCQCVYELVIDASAPLTCVLLVCILIHGFNSIRVCCFNVRTSSWHWKVFQELVIDASAPFNLLLFSNLKQAPGTQTAQLEAFQRARFRLNSYNSSLDENEPTGRLPRTCNRCHCAFHL
jgi:hypothetical protein